MVSYANAVGRDMLGAGRMLGVRDGKLTARRQGEARELRETLATVHPARGGIASAAPSIMTLRDRSGHVIMVLSFEALELPGLPGAICVRMAGLRLPPTIDPIWLMRVFTLTRAEARIAAALLTDPDVTAVAKARGLATETVRSHLKRVMTKLGVRSQAHLVSVLIRASAVMGGSQ